MKVLITFLFLSNVLIAQELIDIKGKVIDSNGKTVPYASIINLTSGNHGTTSNEKGIFTLNALPNTSDIVQITALGFYELRVTVSELAQLAKNGGVVLKEKPTNLGEFQVDGERYKKEFTGKSTHLLKRPDGGYYTYSISAEPGYGGGVFVTPRNKTVGLIDKIHFYLTDQGSPEKPFGVRLLRTTEKLKHNRVYSIDQFDDMSQEVLIFSNGKAGWNSLNLYDFDIYIDDKPFFIVITILESNMEMGNKSQEKMHKSVQIGAFQDQNPHEIFRAVHIDGGLGFSNVKSARVPIPAIYVEYSTIKK